MSMTYDPSQVSAKGAAFECSFNYPYISTNPPADYNSGYKGYPSGTIGGYKAGGTYYPGVKSICGMPVQIKDLNNDLRIQWRVSQQNATDVGDKWWASINVIFDNGTQTSEPVTGDRDYDLVIEWNRYEQEDLSDRPSTNPNNTTNDVYWKFARVGNATSALKTFDLNYGGQVYKWAVRFKFFNYPPGDPNEGKNNKVHVKFIAVDNNNLPAFLDHPLKTFVDATKSYSLSANLNPTETGKVNTEVALPDTWIKSIAAGYEVYTGSFTVRNDVFKTVLDNTAPTAPTGLSAVRNTNNVVLDWADVTTDSIKRYRIYRSTNGSSFQLLDSSAVSAFTDNTINAANNYTYYIKAVDRSFNESSQSVTVSATIVPIELLFFKGQNTEGGNLLTWATATEIRNDRFEIEHSADSKTWATLGSIKGKGKGNSQTQQNYSFLDKNPASQINFYRLKMVDTEGGHEVSKVVVLDNSEKGKIKIYPNPATAFLNIELTTNQSEVVDIQLFNSIGQAVFSTKIEANRGNNLATIPTHAYPAGLYTLSIKKSGVVAIEKVVIR